MRNKERDQAKGSIFFGALFSVIACTFIFMVLERILNDYQFRNYTVTTQAVITWIVNKPYHNYPGDKRLVMKFHDGVDERSGEEPCRFCFDDRKRPLCCGQEGDTVLVRYFDPKNLPFLVVEADRTRFSDDGRADKYKSVTGMIIAGLIFGAAGLWIIRRAIRILRST